MNKVCKITQALLFIITLRNNNRNYRVDCVDISDINYYIARVMKSYHTNRDH